MKGKAPPSFRNRLEVQIAFLLVLWLVAASLTATNLRFLLGTVPVVGHVVRVDRATHTADVRGEYEDSRPATVRPVKLAWSDEIFFRVNPGDLVTVRYDPTSPDEARFVPFGWSFKAALWPVYLATLLTAGAMRWRVASGRGTQGITPGP